MLYMGVLVYFVMYLRGKNWSKRKEKGVTKYKQIEYKKVLKDIERRAKREGRKKKIKNKKVRTKKKIHTMGVLHFNVMRDALDP